MKFLSALEAGSVCLSFRVVNSVFDNISKIKVGEFGVVNCYFGVTSMNDECLDQSQHNTLRRGKTRKNKKEEGGERGKPLGMACWGCCRSPCNKSDRAFHKIFDRHVGVGGRAYRLSLRIFVLP